MKTTIEARWDALAPAPDKPIFQLLDAEHLMLLYIGKSIAGELLLLIVDAEQPSVIKGMKALDISSFQRADGRWNLLLTLRRPELSGVFGLLCEDLASSSRYLPVGISGMQFVARRISAWRKLLEEGGSDILSDDEVRGLIGELVVMERALVLGVVGPREIVRAWEGPKGADQDFQFSKLAWEVKTARADAEFIQISSERQLCAYERVVRLFLVTLTESAEGGSLNSHVERVRFLLQNQIDALDMFEDRLKDLGYVSRASYDEPLFKIGNIRAFRVCEGFPRICHSSLPPGVRDVVYRVQVDACLPFLIDPLQAFNIVCD